MNPSKLAVNLLGPGLALVSQLSQAWSGSLVGTLFLLAVWSAYSQFAWIAGLLLLAALYSLAAHCVHTADTANVIGLGLERISRGDLSNRIADMLDTQSAGLLTRFNQMNGNLVDLVTQVRTSTDNIMRAAIDVATGNRDLGDRTEHQASTLEELASTMEELAATIKENAQRCGDASRLAGESVAVVGRGAESVHAVADTMRRIDAGSKSISDIVNLIEGIAFQTHILALNAAVEAARAGEAGRGFTVVATEVRSLAQRSADAAKDIKRLISDSTADVKAGSRSVAAAAEIMAQVVHSVQSVTELIQGIAHASNEQSEATEEVNRAIVQMESVTQQNATLVQQAAGVAMDFENEVQTLDEAVAQFQTDQVEGRDKAVNWVKRGVAHIEKVGLQQACDDFDDPKGGFIFGEFYISVFDVNGTRMANGLEPWKRGEHIYDIQDVDGKPYVRYIVTRAQSKGYGWVEYNWTSPVSGNVELKSVYFELAQGAVVTSGIYKGARGTSMRRLDHKSGTSQPHQPLAKRDNARAAIAFRR